MIGCGGSGQKAIRYVRDAVARHLEHKGWEGGVPKGWQFIGIDTLTTQEDPDIPFLPNNDYVSVSLEYPTYQGLSAAMDATFGVSNKAAFKDLQGWRPNPSQVAVPLKEGAGQLRAVGRMAGILGLQTTVQKRIEFAFGQCSAGGPELAEVSRHLQVNVPPGSVVPAPLIIIAGSMAGGTGAGIMLDVIDLVRRTHANGQFPVLVAFTPDIFGAQQTDAMTANAAAFMSETMSSYWDDENTDSALIPSKVAVHTRGPHSVFIIGRKNIDGLDLVNPNNVYRAVGEALAAVTTSSTVQTDFNNFITANWVTVASDNAGGYGFQSAHLNGVASSFGSAVISIGRDRFRDYLKKLLHRSVVEHLADGFESVASSLLGDASKSMTGPAKVAELNRRNIEKFMVECGLSEVAEGSRQVSGEFASNEIMKKRLVDVSNKIKTPFNPTIQQRSAIWLQTLGAQQQQVKVQVLQAIDIELHEDLHLWGTSLLHRVLRTSTEFSATLSIPVALSLLATARSKVLLSSSLLHEESKEARKSAMQSDQKARSHLAGNAKGSLQFTAAPVQDTISDLSKAVVLEWSAVVKEKLAVALESVATQMLSNVEASLKQSLSRLSMMTASQDGKPPLVDGWPKNDGVVPTSFAPSPVEFFLEDHASWPGLAKTLLGKSLGSVTGLPIDPVEAARLLIIRGGFGRGGIKGEMFPLVWAESHGTDPVWEPGQAVQVTISDDFDALSERIDHWLVRPATEIFYVLSEGLSAYLMSTHDKTGAAIPNHQERLATFRQQLSEALMQSRPLIEIDNVMNATVHPQPLQYKLNIQGFPFGEGHPARSITESIIQGYLNTPESLDWVFSSGEAESVLITNFLWYPVNPSVVTSLTQPLKKALGSYNQDLLRSSFWRWRRARILENFIPLPDTLRIAAIRGFAVARILGTVTAEPSEQNQISTKDGIYNFPRHLLTETDDENVLPVLLEAMILAFAEASVVGKDAFNAYGALIEYGTGGGQTAGFEISGEVARILLSGDYGSTKILDRARASALFSATGSPATTALKYLERNIEHFEILDAKPLNARSWRNKTGSVDPVETLTRELLVDLRKAYIQVKEAFSRFEMLKSDETGKLV